MKKSIVMMILVIGLMGCATQTQTGGLLGTGVGAAVGAGVGQAIGRDTKGTLVGAAIGAAVGGLAGTTIGRYMDNQEQSMRQAIANSEAASVRREQEIVEASKADATRKSIDVLTVSFKSDYLFTVDSSALLPGARDELERVSQVLNQYPETTIQIAGHTDNTGSEEYNQRLSERRANAVKNGLVQMGVDLVRMTAVGYGETRPIASNNTEAGRQMNRRVEIRIVPQQAQ